MIFNDIIMPADEKEHYRKWGNPPFSVVVVHGGPGAAGSAGSLAAQLGETAGVIEPFQLGKNITEQIEELHSLILKEATLPVILTGHSWGAWLTIFFAATYPLLVQKLILISTPPLTNEYAPLIKKNREARLTSEDRLPSDPFSPASNLSPVELFKQAGTFYSQIDSYDMLPILDDVDYRPDIYSSIWSEAEIWRSSGKIIEMIKRISCPVWAIHGDYDPHPWDGVSYPLNKSLADVNFILLNKCGHYPWKERSARDDFFNEMKKIFASASF
jgi:pimeloyl-ACP methyl ester carboxylesterase